MGIPNPLKIRAAVTGMLEAEKGTAKNLLSKGEKQFHWLGGIGAGEDVSRADRIRRGHFRAGAVGGVVGLSSAASGMRAKSSGGYTGANTY